MLSMKNKMIKLTGLVLVYGLISACDEAQEFIDSDFANPIADATANATNGSADFSTFVSIGDSLTAGYADGALYRLGQENSYPAILAQQFAKVRGGTFKQPLVNDNLGGLLIGGNINSDYGNRRVLNAATQTPEVLAGTPTTEVTSVLTGSFNNMGVPGAKSFHLGAEGLGDPAGLSTNPATANPYFVRFASSVSTSVIEDAAAQAPSFFVLWIGNNDVLSYATEGGVGIDQTGNTDLSTYGSRDITDPTAFAGIYTQLITALTTANTTAKGVLLNIPDIATIPFFTTVPYNAVPLDAATAAALNTAYTAYNDGVQAAQGLSLITAEEAAQRTISFAAGQNAVVILDEDLTDITAVDAALINMRQATAKDLLVLTSSTKIGTLANPEDDPSDPSSPLWGISAPLEDADVLTPAEILAIETARLAYNVSIAAAAEANPNLILLDIAAIMTELSTTGINYGRNGTITATYATGGGFSLDGVHPTARGYSVIANSIIDAINAGFNATIPKVYPGNYTTIFLN